MKEELRLLSEFIRSKGLRHTRQREDILRTFLAVEAHISAEELYRILKKKKLSIGYVSVYRTMKLLEEAGLCAQVDLGDGIVRFEHKYGHPSHNHLICMQCGECLEVADPRLEKMQYELSLSKNFIPLKHKLQILGLCSECAGKSAGGRTPKGAK